jgi:glycerol uptake facilitator protein
VITAGWAIAVFIGVFCSEPFSGGHINPAVTLAKLATGRLGFGKALGYFVAQMSGGIVGAAIVFLFYREHFKASNDADAKLACFSTAPNIRNIPQAFFCEVVGTFLLVLPIYLMTAPSLKPSSETGGDMALGLGSLGMIPVALLVFGIGLSLGGTTGYAINPARDLGPRIAHALLPIPGKRDSDWSYAWVPVAGPLLGGLLAAGVHWLLT